MLSSNDQNIVTVAEFELRSQSLAVTMPYYGKKSPTVVLKEIQKFWPRDENGNFKILSTFVEPFGGSGQFSVVIAQLGLARDKIILNDKATAIMDIHQLIKDAPKELLSGYKKREALIEKYMDPTVFDHLDDEQKEEFATMCRLIKKAHKTKLGKDNLPNVCALSLIFIAKNELAPFEKNEERVAEFLNKVSKGKLDKNVKELLVKMDEETSDEQLDALIKDFSLKFMRNVLYRYFSQRLTKATKDNEYAEEIGEREKIFDFLFYIVNGYGHQPLISEQEQNYTGSIGCEKYLLNNPFLQHLESVSEQFKQEKFELINLDYDEAITYAAKYTEPNNILIYNDPPYRTSMAHDYNGLRFDLDQFYKKITEYNEKGFKLIIALNSTDEDKLIPAFLNIEKDEKLNALHKKTRATLICSNLTPTETNQDTRKAKRKRNHSNFISENTLEKETWHKNKQHKNNERSSIFYNNESPETICDYDDKDDYIYESSDDDSDDEYEINTKQVDHKVERSNEKNPKSVTLPSHTPESDETRGPTVCSDPTCGAVFRKGVSCKVHIRNNTKGGMSDGCCREHGDDPNPPKVHTLCYCCKQQVIGFPGSIWPIHIKSQKHMTNALEFAKNNEADFQDLLFANRRDLEKENSLIQGMTTECDPEAKVLKTSVDLELNTTTIQKEATQQDNENEQTVTQRTKEKNAKPKEKSSKSIKEAAPRPTEYICEGCSQTFNHDTSSHRCPSKIHTSKNEEAPYLKCRCPHCQKLMVSTSFNRHIQNMHIDRGNKVEAIPEQKEEIQLDSNMIEANTKHSAAENTLTTIATATPAMNISANTATIMKAINLVPSMKPNKDEDISDIQTDKTQTKKPTNKDVVGKIYCSDCGKIQGDNKAHSCKNHQGKKPILKWCCPECEKEMTVMNKGRHMRNVHHIQKTNVKDNNVIEQEDSMVLSENLNIKSEQNPITPINSKDPNFANTSFGVFLSENEIEKREFSSQRPPLQTNTENMSDVSEPNSSFQSGTLEINREEQIQKIVL